ncbi:MAG TPA: hypothetical protein VKU19_35305 [Bryobacteraceae bacterium]|nr:hypothetical protein [Bryobacteraceae bacterium]
MDWDHSAQKKITQLFLNRTSQSVGASGNRITIHLKPEDSGGACLRARLVSTGEQYSCIVLPVAWDHSTQKKITQLLLNRTSQSVGANGQSHHDSPEARKWWQRLLTRAARKY